MKFVSLSALKYGAIGGGLFAAALAMPAVFGGCTSSSDGPSEPETIAGLDEVVAHYVDTIVIEDLELTRQKTSALSNAIVAHQAELADDPNSALSQSTRTDAQQAWQAAMQQWQRVELLQVGPLGPVGVAAGGESKRDEVYSFPLANPCGVDQNIVDQSYESANFITASTVNEYGFDALEQLLFAPGFDNACPRPAAINADGTWAELSEAQIQSRRADYAKVVADQIVDVVTDVEQKWQSSFGAEMKEGSGEAFDSPRDSLNAMFAGLFYIELVSKDRKLGQPAGLHINCASEVCPDDVEHSISGISMSALASNLAQAEDIYFGRGEDAPAFDDLVADAGREDLNDSMAAAIARAKAAFDAIDSPLEDSLAQDPAAARAAHAALKDVTDLIKADLVSVLNLEIPQEGAGDND